LTPGKPGLSGLFQKPGVKVEFESGVIFCFMNLVAVTSVNHIILFSPTLALCANMVFNVLGEFQNERHVKGPKQAAGVKESI
jgi:hypothetical protein